MRILYMRCCTVAYVCVFVEEFLAGQGGLVPGQSIVDCPKTEARPSSARLCSVPTLGGLS